MSDEKTGERLLRLSQEMLDDYTPGDAVKVVWEDAPDSDEEWVRQINEMQDRIRELEAVLKTVRDNMSKRRVFDFDYENGEYPVTAEVVQMLVLEKQELRAENEALRDYIDGWEKHKPAGLDDLRAENERLEAENIRQLEELEGRNVYVQTLEADNHRLKQSLHKARVRIARAQKALAHPTQEEGL